jgi:RimJ/RimL family protein N-acetyltransferase
MNEPLETERLSLRPLGWDDLPFLVELHADAEVSRYLGHGRPRSEDETRQWLAQTLAAGSEGLGQRGVLLKGDDRLVGRCGLTCFELEQGAVRPRGFWGRASQPHGVATAPVLELGYTFQRRSWGNGYALEAARRMRDHALADRGEARVVSFIYPGNARSIRVAESNGLVQRGEVEIFDHLALRYEITREEWDHRP